MALDFDDILLTPRVSIVNSRENVDISMNIGKGVKLDIPIIASPMKGITGVQLIEGISELGGIGILHRFYTDLNLWGNNIDWLKDKVARFGVAIGLNEYGKLEYLNAIEPTIVCIDVANGYLKTVHAFTKDVVESFSNKNTLVMVGNVATLEGARELLWAGADLIRIGIGSGSLCTTRNITGVGIPQLTAISNSAHVSDGTKARTVADGGIRNSGDAVKAFVFGADVLMLGSLFAGVYESANNGIVYGMASRTLQEEYYHSVKSVEGIKKRVTPKQTLAEFIDEFTYGIKSACTYLNAQTLYDLRKAHYIEVSPNAIKKF
jgi:IMP dehydrogenase